MNRKTVKVPNITCNHCVMTIKNELSELSGVKSVEGDPESKMITVEWDDSIDWDSISETLKEINYPAEE
ncbi:MAG: heavy metal-associated domain-containing protein [bacterium]